MPWRVSVRDILESRLVEHIVLHVAKDSTDLHTQSVKLSSSKPVADALQLEGPLDPVSLSL